MKAEEALAKELVVFGVFLQQVNTTFGDAVLNLGLRVLGTSPHDAGPEVHTHLGNSLFQVCNKKTNCIKVLRQLCPKVSRFWEIVK